MFAAICKKGNLLHPFISRQNMPYMVIWFIGQHVKRQNKRGMFILLRIWNAICNMWEAHKMPPKDGQIQNLHATLEKLIIQVFTSTTCQGVQTMTKNRKICNLHYWTPSTQLWRHYSQLDIQQGQNVDARNVLG